MASKKDGDRRKHSPMKNPPTRSPSNRKANDATKSLSRRMFLWAVAFGFVLGLCVSSMYSLISEADAHLRHSTARYDLAVNQLPNIPKCDNSKTETALTQNSKTEQKSQGEHDEGKEARDIQADQPIPQPRHVENADDKSQQQPQNEIASEQNQPSNASNEMHVEEKKESPEASEVETRKEINNTGVPKYDKLQQNQPGNASNEMHVEEKKESPEAPEVETRKEINNTGVPKYDKLNLEYDYDGLGIKDFDPNASAVIVSKIHANDTIPTVIQCFCLLHHAYNNRVNYDIVLFASVPISEEELQPIRDNIWPAKFTLVVDNPGLQEMVDALEPERKADLLNRCNVTSSSELTWLTRCREVMSSHETFERTAYNWQAEFRSLHLWVHPVLSQYKYMLWMDTDAFATKVWKQDPIATMRRYDLALLFDHFPQGTAKGTEYPYRFQEAFNKTICSIDMKWGMLTYGEGKCLGKSVRIKQVHGFFHVSDLDFYRSEPVKHWSRVFIGDTKFSRFYDDQIAVTVPAAVLAGNRSWDMRRHGVRLDVFHNFLLDGYRERAVGGFVKYWKANAKERFPEAVDKCWIHIKG